MDLNCSCGKNNSIFLHGSLDIKIQRQDLFVAPNLDTSQNVSWSAVAIAVELFIVAR